MHDDGKGWDDIHSNEQDRKIKALECRIATISIEFNAIRAGQNELDSRLTILEEKEEAQCSSTIQTSPTTNIDTKPTPES